jgi:hypothetical protein
MSCELEYEEYEPDWEDIELWQEQEREQAVALVDELAQDYGWIAPADIIQQLGESLHADGDLSYEADFEEGVCMGVTVEIERSKQQLLHMVLSRWSRRLRRPLVQVVRPARRVLVQRRPRQVRRRRIPCATRAGPARSSDDDPSEPADLSLARSGGRVSPALGRAA